MNFEIDKNNLTVQRTFELNPELMEIITSVQQLKIKIKNFRTLPFGNAVEKEKQNLLSALDYFSIDLKEDIERQLDWANTNL